MPVSVDLQIEACTGCSNCVSGRNLRRVVCDGSNTRRGVHPTKHHGSTVIVRVPNSEHLEKSQDEHPRLLG